MTEYLTTRELADLLRIKERKVYDLAASGSVPCSKATGKLLFPKDDVQAWLEESRSGPVAASRPDVFLGSHDPLLDWALRESGCGIATFFDGSGDGLEKFGSYKGIAAGLHLRDGDGWNVGPVAEQCRGMPVVLVSWAVRQRGLIVAEAAKKRIRALSDLNGAKVAPRQAGAGAQLYAEHLLDEAGVTPDWTEPARTEHDAALAVQEGRADAAFGLEVLAEQYRLPFLPLAQERFDLLVDRRAWFDPPMQRFLAFCGGEAFRAKAASLKGYDVSAFGSVVFNG